MELTLVRFKRSYQSYNVKDVAGFTARAAAFLVATGYADKVIPEEQQALEVKIEAERAPVRERMWQKVRSAPRKRVE